MEFYFYYFSLPVPNTKCFTRISSVISDAIALAIVIFAISISMGKLLAKKHDYEVDANQVFAYHHGFSD
jgi:MFS superfamily sulfate permease-like transporter